MKYLILPLDTSDLPEINVLFLDAFESNDIRLHLWLNVPREEHLAHQLRHYFTVSTLDRSRFVKAVEPESGYVCFLSPFSTTFTKPCSLDPIVLELHLRHFVFRSCIDHCSKIVAFAKWQFPHTLTAEQKAAKERADKKADEENPLPVGTNIELYSEFFGALKERRRKFLDDSKDYCQSILSRKRSPPI